MKSTALKVKEKLIAKYLQKDTPKIVQPNIDVNVLLNRVKLDQKKESRKKILFTAITSLGVVLFGVLIF